ncbi:T9SS type A sorting domain-containing protein [Aureisphaera sp. CAU 1614]|uniref:T9SS type A sorting domain-containing protein n=1 Tax=Halomarinibacterium sedimenti TaxID=2857106 RepID=A0A9X1JVZ9_9FLAO|nr:T9SS type A sorting domain-containing protein [Halomarinibacterium sedimenti]MBW2938539.1 T9SS type A sorting domain-containing protein [Halomarinibacterium sedimenti]
MKKIILFFLFVSIKGLAQDPDFFQTWYLYHMLFENSPSIHVGDFDPPISPTLTINPNLEFNGEGACNTFQGTFIYEFEGFEVETSTYTTAVCGEEQDNFEQLYFGFFSIGTPFGIQIEDQGDNIQRLQIHGGTFRDLIYYNTPNLSIEAFNQQNILISPNPASKTLFITSENLQMEQLSVFNLSGQKVMELKEVATEIDVSSLQNGIYFLKITSEEGTAIKKFVKK